MVSLMKQVLHSAFDKVILLPSKIAICASKSWSDYTIRVDEIISSILFLKKNLCSIIFLPNLYLSKFIKINLSNFSLHISEIAL